METHGHALTKANGPHSRRAIDYSYVMKGIVDAAKSPGFTDAAWAPLAELVDTARFRRVGNFMESVDWNQYVPLLSMWARGTGWTFDVRRVTEGDRHAVLELREYAVYPDRQEEYNSVSVYEFDEAGKLIHLDVYLQKKASPEAGQSPTWDLEKVGAQV